MKAPLPPPVHVPHTDTSKCTHLHVHTNTHSSWQKLSITALVGYFVKLMTPSSWVSFGQMCSRVEGCEVLLSLTHAIWLSDLLRSLPQKVLFNQQAPFVASYVFPVFALTHYLVLQHLWPLLLFPCCHHCGLFFLCEKGFFPPAIPISHGGVCYWWVGMLLFLTPGHAQAFWGHWGKNRADFHTGSVSVFLEETQLFVSFVKTEVA